MSYQRFGDRHSQNYERLLGTMRGFGRPGHSPEDRRRQEQAQMWNTAAEFAPAAGTAIGGGLGALAGGALGSLAGPAGIIPGAGIGMTVGSGLGQAGGQLVGGMMGNESDRLMQAQRERELERQQLMLMLMAMR